MPSIVADRVERPDLYSIDGGRAVVVDGGCARYFFFLTVHSFISVRRW